MEIPKVTRLRFARSSDPAMLQAWLESLSVRVQIHGCPQWDGKAWWLWFIPDDRGADIPSMDLDSI